jgi:hypothetical protein
MNIRKGAVSLQKELEKSLGVSPKIRWGSAGQLDVIADGKVIFSKQETGRIPTAEEIVKILNPV